jgi:DsbE subfamily thiol:disulfide oxidoreductase
MGSKAGRRLGILVVFVVIAGCGPSAPDPLAGIRFAEISGPMPRLSGPALQGGLLGPASYMGKVVLVNFWASWCLPCRQEQPRLEGLWRQLGGGGDVSFIGVDYKDQSKPGRAFLREFRVTYPSVSDPSGDLGSRFGLSFMPSTFLVDRHGQMRYRLTGDVATTAANLRMLISRLLSG